MALRQKAEEYFEEVVKPAISELIFEYRLNGYETGIHKPIVDNKPGIGVGHGIWVQLPGGRKKTVSVFWPKGVEHILVSDHDSIGAKRYKLSGETDRELLKKKIKELVK
jgi:hypothetical protein